MFHEKKIIPLPGAIVCVALFIFATLNEEANSSSPAYCPVRVTDEFVSPEINAEALSGFISFANQTSNGSLPLNLNNYIQTPQPISQNWINKAESWRFPEEALRYRFIQYSPQTIGEALAYNAHNNQIRLDLFANIPVQFSHDYFRLADNVSGFVFHWLGKLEAPNQGTQIRAFQIGNADIEAKFSIGDKLYLIKSVDTTILAIAEFSHINDATCGNN